MARKASKKKSKPMAKKTVENRSAQHVRMNRLSAATNRALNPDQYLTPVMEDENTEAYWEEINELYNVISKGLVDLSSAVNTLVNKKDMVDRLPPESKGRLNVLLKAFTKDIQAMSGSLKEVRAKHENLRGKVEEKEDLYDFVSYFQEYLRLKDVMADAIQPVYIEIAALFMDIVPDDKELTETMKDAVVTAAIESASV